MTKRADLMKTGHGSSFETNAKVGETWNILENRSPDELRIPARRERLGLARDSAGDTWRAPARRAGSRRSKVENRNAERKRTAQRRKEDRRKDTPARFPRASVPNVGCAKWCWCERVHCGRHAGT